MVCQRIHVAERSIAAIIGKYRGLSRDMSAKMPVPNKRSTILQKLLGTTAAESVSSIMPTQGCSVRGSTVGCLCDVSDAETL